MQKGESSGDSLYKIHSFCLSPIFMNAQEIKSKWRMLPGTQVPVSLRLPEFPGDERHGEIVPNPTRFVGLFHRLTR